MLYQPEIPPNTGNIGRTCVAIAAKLWLVRPLGFSLEDRYLARSGLDYWEHLDYEAVDDWAALSAAVEINPERTWYFTKTATRMYTDAKFQTGDMLVFGRETTGLPREMIDAAGDHALRMPIRPQVRSLNLANTVAVAAYEALRQFNVSAPPS